MISQNSLRSLVMLIFKQTLKQSLKCLVIGLFALLTACSNLNLIKDKPEQTKGAQVVKGSDVKDLDVKNAETQLLTESGNNQTVADPMAAVDLPLTLIKGYDEVTSLLKSKQKEKAQQKLASLHTEHPTSSGPSYRLARLLLEQKQYQQALDWVNKSIAIKPQNYYAINLKGVLLRELGQFDQAKESYLKAIEVYPDFPKSHLNVGVLADLYLYDLVLALKHYQIYMVKNKVEDKKVAGWILDLKRRISTAE